MAVTYTNYVFNTLTYDRNLACRHLAWWRVARDCTDYVQRLRRHFPVLRPIEYLRVIESHQDFYPHIHILLHFTQSLRVDNARYFDREFFRRLQSCWTFGFSKPEVLRYPDNAFNYTLKYFLKQITNNDSSDGSGSNDGDGTGIEERQPKVWPLKGKRFTFFGMPIRILAWSRGMQYLYQKRTYESLKLKGFKPELPSILVLRKNTQHAKLLKFPA